MIKSTYQYRYQTVEDVLSELKNIKNPPSSQVTQVISPTPTTSPVQTLPITEIIVVLGIVVISIYSLCAAAGKIPAIKERKSYKQTIYSKLLW